MKNILFTLFVAFIGVTSVNAQQFKTAIGGRLGSPLGVTFKTFISETDAIDLTVGFSNRGIGTSIAALAQYQRHADLDVEGVKNLQWFYGAAVSGNFWSYFGLGGVYVGGHAALGLSYTLEDEPLNISLEINPGLFVGGGDYYNGVFLSYYSGICGRYIISN